MANQIQKRTNDVQVFNSPMFGDIRVVGTGEKPLFCLADVCKALSYSNAREALRKHIDIDDVVKRDTLTNGGIQSLNCVNEPNLYKCINR